MGLGSYHSLMPDVSGLSSSSLTGRSNIHWLSTLLTYYCSIALFDMLFETVGYSLVPKLQ